MTGINRYYRIISFVLVAALLWAPVLPAFAFVSHTGDTHAVHNSHDGGKANAAVGADEQQSPCSHHDFCNGQCCDSCVQCASVPSFVYRGYSFLYPAQIPVLTLLHSLVVVTSPERPPRFFSL